ncbi:MAG: zinc ribbon domain-containing protein, partial [Chloroflexi bacterium]
MPPRGPNHAVLSQLRCSSRRCPALVADRNCRLMAVQVGYCGRCGAALTPGAPFCGTCGTPVGPVVPMAAAASATPAAYQ